MECDVTAANRSSRRLDFAPAGDTSPEFSSPKPDRAAAVSALYAEHVLGLVRLAHVMLGSQQAAEDIVQEAFLGLYRRWLHLDDQAKALQYVRSAVLNGCRSALRTSRYTHPGPMPENSSQHPTASSAESAVLTDEERRQIIAALRLLPSRQREVLALRFYLDLPDDQIAAAMNIRQSTVRSTAHRGLAALGRALRELS
jgi:RNA polymerase sigma factor (sigma-70 family)